MSTITKQPWRIVRYGAVALLVAGFGAICLLIVLFILFSSQATLRESKNRLEAAPPTGRFVLANDVEIFIQEMGPADGPPILFIHGTAAWSEIWRETMTALAAAGYHPIAIDLPPFGYSERPAAASYNRQAQAKRIIGVLDALNIPQATLVGHSFGGGATVEAAMLAPNRVKTLVLVDVALGLTPNGNQNDSKPVLLNTLLSVSPLRNGLVALTMTNPLFTKTALQSLILDPNDATDTVVTMLQQPFVIKNTTPAYGDWLPVLLNPPETSLSTNVASNASLTMPMLIIWGDSDTIVPLTDGKYLHSLIPAAELVVLQQVNHIPHIEDAAAFNAALLRFLTKQLS